MAITLETVEEVVVGDVVEATQEVMESQEVEATAEGKTLEHPIVLVQGEDGVFTTPDKSAEEPAPTRTTDDAAPRTALDDLLDCISNAHLTCMKAKATVFDRELMVKAAQLQLKVAKEDYALCVDNMLELTAKLNADQNRPLFPIDKEISQEATDVAPDAGLPLTDAAPSAADNTWRAESIDELPDTTPATIDLLRKGDIATMGELADLIACCEGESGGDHWPKGIGKVKQTQIIASITAWQEARSSQDSSEVPVSIDWDSLSHDEQCQYLEGRAARLRAKSVEELGEMHGSCETFDSGLEAFDAGDLVVNCPYVPTASGDWSRVDAWIAAWLWASKQKSNDTDESTNETD